MNFAVERFTEFQVRNEDNEIVATFYAGANDEGKFTLQGDKFSLSSADTMQFLQWMNEWAKASDKEKIRGYKMIRFVKEIEINEGNLSGAVNIFFDTVERVYTASVDLNEVMDEIYKKGFKTVKDAQAWAFEQVEKHLEE